MKKLLIALTFSAVLAASTAYAGPRSLGGGSTGGGFTNGGGAVCYGPPAPFCGPVPQGACGWAITPIVNPDGCVNGYRCDPKTDGCPLPTPAQNAPALPLDECQYDRVVINTPDFGLQMVPVNIRGNCTCSQIVGANCAQTPGTTYQCPPSAQFISEVCG